ncbi:hypothetical protein CLF_104822 [Clonorchis sinensis]|uniref:Uncharacterized protein n=1 Tax=Clonorchis sinensis TaxID=79923 RepID=G7YCF4_CLOSI|nr:hypothetical protein CLF_104822 [Clonorchis sinensis]
MPIKWNNRDESSPAATNSKQQRFFIDSLNQRPYSETPAMGEALMLLDGWRVYERAMVQRNRATHPAGRTDNHTRFVMSADSPICVPNAGGKKTHRREHNSYIPNKRVGKRECESELGTISYVRCLSDTEAIGPLFNNSRLQHLLTESDKHAVSDVEIRKNGMSLRGESADGSTDTTIKAELTKRDGRSPMPLRTYSIECQTCTDCKLPIGGTGTTAVGSTTCDECRLVLTFAKGKTSKIDAECIAPGNACDFGITKNSDQSTVVSACCDTDNCNTVQGETSPYGVLHYRWQRHLWSSLPFVQAQHGWIRNGGCTKRLTLMNQDYVTISFIHRRLALRNPVIVAHLYAITRNNTRPHEHDPSSQGPVICKFLCFIDFIESRLSLESNTSTVFRLLQPALPNRLTLRAKVNFTTVIQLAAVNRDSKTFHQQADKTVTASFYGENFISTCVVKKEGVTSPTANRFAAAKHYWSRQLTTGGVSSTKLPNGGWVAFSFACECTYQPAPNWRYLKLINSAETSVITFNARVYFRTNTDLFHTKSFLQGSFCSKGLVEEAVVGKFQHASPVSLFDVDYEASSIHDNLTLRPMTTRQTHNCIQYRPPSLRILTARPVSVCDADSAFWNRLQYTYCLKAFAMGDLAAIRRNLNASSAISNDLPGTQPKGAEGITFFQPELGTLNLKHVSETSAMQASRKRVSPLTNLNWDLNRRCIENCRSENSKGWRGACSEETSAQFNGLEASKNYPGFSGKEVLRILQRDDSMRQNQGINAPTSPLRNSNGELASGSIVVSGTHKEHYEVCFLLQLQTTAELLDLHGEGRLPTIAHAKPLQRFRAGRSPSKEPEENVYQPHYQIVQSNGAHYDAGYLNSPQQCQLDITGAIRIPPNQFLRIESARVYAQRANVWLYSSPLPRGESAQKAFAVSRIIWRTFRRTTRIDFRAPYAFFMSSYARNPAAARWELKEQRYIVICLDQSVGRKPLNDKNKPDSGGFGKSLDSVCQSVNQWERVRTI